MNWSIVPGSESIKENWSMVPGSEVNQKLLEYGIWK
jgi:hypothetical protein